MNKKLLVVLLAAAPFFSQAQFGKLLNKVKDKAQQRADNKVDKTIDKTLDDVEGTAKKKDAPATNTDTKPADNNNPKVDDTKADASPTIKSYSKFDFIPGEKVIYAEDFAPDAIGELPLTWNSSGKGEVMTIEGKTGKWVRGHENNTLLTGNKQPFGENYTVEFDIIYFFQPKVTGYLMPAINFTMFSSGTKDNTDNTFLNNRAEIAMLQVAIHPSDQGAATVNSYQKHATVFHSDRVETVNFMKRVNTPVHYSIQVQKSRFRLWQNEVKLFDVPRAIGTGDIYNQLAFHMEGSNYKDDEVGYYLSNIKVSTGVPDTRHKLIEEGKFSTTGILFDFQSAVIRPESYGVIKEIGGVLKENPTVKVNIIGHTSNDGDAKANLELSKQRAAAVKGVLIKEYGIEEGRLQTDGKGGTQPVADNKTPEGKSQNRRVEFIKL
jgi:outer membrane protein OmpA-like peptidoglycan-associated protein